MNLLDLAKLFDEADPALDMEARIVLAEEMKPLLGEKREEFDRRHDALVEERCPAPAQETLRRMGLGGNG